MSTIDPAVVQRGHRQTVGGVLGLGTLAVVGVQLAFGIHPVVYGLLAAAFFVSIGMLVKGSLNPLDIVTGQDNRLSTSQFQFFLWTGVVAFSYGWLYAIRAQHNLFEALGALPGNVLVAMGFSVVTVTAAKAITATQVRAGQVKKVRGTPHIGDLFTDDKGVPDLPKTQMLFWTVLAVAIFLINVIALADTFATCSLGSKGCKFPDIDTTLMALMGLGQGAYLGVKMVPPSNP